MVYIKIEVNHVKICELCKEVIMPGMAYMGRDVLEEDGQITEHYTHSGVCPKWAQQQNQPISGGGFTQPYWVQSPYYTFPQTQQGGTGSSTYYGSSAQGVTNYASQLALQQSIQPAAILVPYQHTGNNSYATDVSIDSGLFSRALEALRKAISRKEKNEEDAEGNNKAKEEIYS